MASRPPAPAGKPSTTDDVPETVIAMYRPKPGKGAELDALVRRHVPTLRDLGLATKTRVVVLEASDGTRLEIFEWRNAAAPDAAHRSKEVGAVWDAMGAACDFVSLGQLAEAGRPFPHFRRRADLES
jgi:hypothetical protein